MVKKFLRKLKDAPIIYVKPSDIQNQHSLDKGNIDLNGDWDNLGMVVQKGFIFKSFKERLNGAQWEQTTLFKRKKRLGKRWTRKLPIWDSMLNDIVTNGYTQRPNDDFIDKYISILIGRNGHMFIYNGIHRLCCCLLSSKVDKIPVKVLLRHSEWDKFRSICIRYSIKRRALYCQIPHPDLESIHYFWTNERAELIAENSINSTKKVLDAGTHWGTTSSVLASKGFNCLAIEASPQHYRKLVKISKFPNAKFTPELGDVTTKYWNETLLLLNIAHHYIIDKTRLKRFTNWLSYIKPKEIFYQAHHLDDKWSPYMKPEEMLNIISSNTNLTSIKSLKEFNGRNLYHLT